MVKKYDAKKIAVQIMLAPGCKTNKKNNNKLPGTGNVYSYQGLIKTGSVYLNQRAAKL